jgi:F-type H+-transporting ATPase subunit gamma
MASLKEIRTRITSVSSTRQLTSAMKMVSASKLRRAQDAILQIRPYANKLKEILIHISTGMDTSDDNIYARQREIKNVLIIVIASNRGLCGAFNSNVVKGAIQLAETKYPKQLNQGKVKFFTISKKAHELLKINKFDVIESRPELYDDLRFSSIKSVPEAIMDSFSKGKYDRVEIVYNEFKNAAVQVLKKEQFLPIEIDHSAGNVSFVSNYIYEPSKEYIVDELIPKSLKIQFYKALLDSYAAEHGARMTAMHIATDNATDIIKALRLNYNKARQASITKQILEIVGGANALEG